MTNRLGKVEPRVSPKSIVPNARAKIIPMKVTAQYAQEHLPELLETADHGEVIEIARDGKPSAKLIVMPSAQSPRHKEKQIQDARIPDVGLHGDDIPVFGAGRGEIALPPDEEWSAMDREIEALMLNGPLFPDSKG